MPKIEDSVVSVVPVEELETVIEEYTVKEGDTLWDIAEEKLGDAFKWNEILAVNPEIGDADFIYPGQVIKIPVNSDSKNLQKDGMESGPESEDDNDLVAVAAGFVGWSACKTAGQKRRSVLTHEAFRKLEEKEYNRKFIKW